MTSVWGNDNGGGGSGANGHRVIVTYSVTGQSVAGNYSDIYWQYGVDYGNPNWWANIGNRSIAWSVSVGASVAGVSGYGTGTSSAPLINTSDPGYGGQIHYFWDGTVRIYHNSSGQATIHLAASMSFNSSAYTSSISTDIAMSDIVQAPTAPSGCTASRVSNTQISVSWTNNSTSHHEYDSVKVYRSTDGGGYALVATLGVVTSYSDTGVSANHKYTYKAEAVNAAGSAQSSASSAVFTTPAADTSMTATKLSGGNVRVDWTVNSNYKSNSDLQHDIYDKPNGGAGVYLDSVFGATATYTHVSPDPSKTHAYYTVTFPPSTSLFATSSVSNTVTLLSTAGAPTGLSPSGAYFDATEAIVLTWTHNPTDGTPQSKYQLQYAVDGGAYTTVGPTTSANSTYTIPASTLTNGHTITWRVATAGENGTIGSYSSVATFYTQNRPTSTINTPSGGSYTESVLTATWTYFQAQSAAQASWHAYLWRKGALSDYSDAVLVGEQAGSGTTSTVTFTGVVVEDGATYGVRVFVTSANGLESVASGTEREEFTVAYLPPAQATLSLEYEAGRGRVIITIQGSAPTVGVTENIATVDLQRQIDGGDWVTWVAGIVLDVGTLQAVLIDPMPTIVGNNNYRAVMHSDVPSSAYSAEVDVDVAETAWCFLSSFQGNFADALRMRAEVATRATVGRNKAVYEFAGREDPVELSGENRSRKLSVTGTLSTTDVGVSCTPRELEDMGETTGIVLWRDFTGRRMFASLSDVNVDYVTQARVNAFAFSLTRVDYDEDVE